MMRKILLVIASAGVLFMPAVVSAATDADGSLIRESLCAGANLQVGSDCQTGGISDKDAQDKINAIIKMVINIFSLIVGVISVIMIIIGGLKYITSGGDSSNVTGAKNTILYAIIGLIVVAMAQFIVRFVLTKINATTSGGSSGGLVN